MKKTHIIIPMIGIILLSASQIILPNCCSADQTQDVTNDPMSMKFSKYRFADNSFFSTNSIPENESHQCKALWNTWHGRFGTRLMDVVYAKFEVSDFGSNVKPCEIKFKIIEGKVVDPVLKESSNFKAYDEAVLESLREIRLEKFPHDSKTNTLEEILVIEPHLYRIGSKNNQIINPLLVPKMYGSESLANPLVVPKICGFDQITAPKHETQKP